MCPPRPTKPPGFTTHTPHRVLPSAVGAASAAMAVTNALVVALSCVFYMVCSAGMMIINKVVLRSLPLPMTVVMIQMATTSLCIVTTSSSLHFGSVTDVLRWATTIPNARRD